ncbi:hypothetical protein [Haladaptatus sp. R4]|uniref:Cap15 family cyclic dinucleotide receptor domain-containing protein n=1 Tax=Haladaptatus sp. R4 TaxID=1679489 RepID=UPI001CC128AE|nr:hypothetical protein [Haladaptatus sp. R4]
MGALWLGQAVLGVLGIVSFGGAATIIYTLFTRFLWRWSWVRKIARVKVPDLRGEWEGYLYTSADSDEIKDELILNEGEQKDDLTKMEASVTIEQTWDKVEVTLDGPESQSHSEGATITVNEKAWPTITYNYLNEGTATNGDLNMHYGTTSLEYDEDANKLEGPYYNRPDQRDSQGYLELYRKDE